MAPDDYIDAFPQYRADTKSLYEDDISAQQEALQQKIASEAALKEAAYANPQRTLAQALTQAFAGAIPSLAGALVGGQRGAGYGFQAGGQGAEALGLHYDAQDKENKNIAQSEYGNAIRDRQQQENQIDLLKQRENEALLGLSGKQIEEQGQESRFGRNLAFEREKLKAETDLKKDSHIIVPITDPLTGHEMTVPMTVSEYTQYQNNKNKLPSLPAGSNEVISDMKTMETTLQNLPPEYKFTGANVPLITKDQEKIYDQMMIDRRNQQYIYNLKKDYIKNFGPVAPGPGEGTDTQKGKAWAVIQSATLAAASNRPEAKGGYRKDEMTSIIAGSAGVVPLVGDSTLDLQTVGRLLTAQFGNYSAENALNDLQKDYNMAAGRLREKEKIYGLEYDPPKNVFKSPAEANKWKQGPEYQSWLKDRQTARTNALLDFRRSQIEYRRKMMQELGRPFDATEQ